MPKLERPEPLCGRVVLSTGEDRAPSPSPGRATRTTQTLSNDATLANASGSRESSSKLVSGLDGSAIVTTHGAPMNRRTRTCHSRIKRGTLRERRSAPTGRTRGAARSGTAGARSIRPPANAAAPASGFWAMRWRRDPERPVQRKGRATTRQASSPPQGAFQGSVAIHGVISHVAIPW